MWKGCGGGGGCAPLPGELNRPHPRCGGGAKRRPGALGGSGPAAVVASGGRPPATPMLHVGRGRGVGAHRRHVVPLGGGACHDVPASPRRGRRLRGDGEGGLQGGEDGWLRTAAQHGEGLAGAYPAACPGHPRATPKESFFLNNQPWDPMVALLWEGLAVYLFNVTSGPVQNCVCMQHVACFVKCCVQSPVSI